MKSIIVIVTESDCLCDGDSDSDGQWWWLSLRVIAFVMVIQQQPDEGILNVSCYTALEPPIPEKICGS